MDKNLLMTALVLTGTLGFGCSSNDMGSRSRSAGNSSGQSTAATSSQTASASPTASGSQQKNAAKISNADMRKVEEALKSKGYDPGPINGEMDAQTSQALRDFQKKNNLADTGTMDQA